MIATCTKCGSKNRLPVPLGTRRVRCGQCKYELSIAALAAAVNEPAPPRAPIDWDAEDDADEANEEDEDEDDD